MDRTSQIASEAKPERLYFKTYLRLIENSIGSKMFQNFYVRSSAGQEFDALGQGSNACAFYVSAVLVIFKKLARIHGTVNGTIKDLHESGWREVAEVKPGDVLVWEAMEFADGRHEHIGFYIGDNQAISTSQSKQQVVKHDMYFGNTQRHISQILRMENWS